MHPESIKTQRIEWIDCLKGFGMICVVLGHLSPAFPIEKLLYSFHIPLFFFLSGLVTKESKNNRSVLKKLIMNILVPFLIWDALSFVVSLVFLQDDLLTCIYRALFLNGLRSWNAPIWFLLVLFLTKTLYVLFHKIHIPNFITIIVMIAVSPFISPLKSFPFLINLVPLSMAFLLIGVESRKIFIENKWDIVQTKSVYKVIMAALSFILLIVFGLFLNIRISYTGADFGNFLYFYLASLGGVFFFSIVFSLSPPHNHTCMTLLNRIGKDSLFIMCFQYWIFYIIDYVSGCFLGISLWHYRNTLKAVVITVITISMCMVITYLFRRLSQKIPKIRPLISGVGIS